MSRLALVLVALLLAGSCEKDPDGSTVTFSYSAPGPGTVIRSSYKLIVEPRVVAEVDGKPAGERVLRLSRKVRMTTVVFAHDAPARLRITYDEATDRRTSSAGSEDLPVTGRTYLVVEADDGYEITAEDGAAPSPEELAIVGRTPDALFRASGLSSFLDGRRVRLGETLIVPEETADEVLGVRDDRFRTERVVLTLASVRPDDTAVFSASASLRMIAGPDVELTAELEGEIVLTAATCRPLHLLLAGLLEVRGTGEVPMRGSGPIRIEIDVDYE